MPCRFFAQRLTLHPARAFIAFWPLLAMFPAAADSNLHPPLPMNNRTPFTQVFMAPTAPDISLNYKQHQISTQIDLSSHSLIQSRDDTQLELDGESLRVTIDWQYRVAQRWIVRAELPFVSHSGGFLDRIIDGWHNLTGLPDGERDRQAADRLLFGFQNDRQIIVTDTRQQAIGDLSLATAYRLQGNSSFSQHWQYNSWIQLGLKLPTGSARRMSGSEATDMSLSFHHQRQQSRAHRPWGISVDVYALHIGGGNIIDSTRQMQWMTNLKASIEWTDTLIPEAQLRYRSAAYSSPIPALGDDSLGLDLGITLVRNSGYWKIGFSEDLDIDSGPDVGLYVQYMHRLNR